MMTGAWATFNGSYRNAITGEAADFIPETRPHQTKLFPSIHLKRKASRVGSTAETMLSIGHMGKLAHIYSCRSLPSWHSKGFPHLDEQ